MAKTRIIIADTDIPYILTLQQKFVEEFFEKIDLEIITERGYFEELFSTPQKADILILSEDLYDPSLQRHNLSHLFLLTEQKEEGVTAELHVDRIYKYSSVHEIFNEVLGKCSDALQIKGTVKKEPQIVVVTSAAGGVGKTTVALGLSAALSKDYKRVLYLNAEWVQTFQFLLQNQDSITENEVYRELMHPDKNIYNRIRRAIREEQFSYLPPFKAAMLSLGIETSVFQKIAESAKRSGDYDYIVIDTDSTFDENKASLLGMADKVVLVTSQNRASVLATNCLAGNVNGIENEKYIFLCNNFEPEKENALKGQYNALKLEIAAYISHFENYQDMSSADFTDEISFRRAAYLLE